MYLSQPPDGCHHRRIMPAATNCSMIDRGLHKFTLRHTTPTSRNHFATMVWLGNCGRLLRSYFKGGAHAGEATQCMLEVPIVCLAT